MPENFTPDTEVNFPEKSFGKGKVFSDMDSNLNEKEKAFPTEVFKSFYSALNDNEKILDLNTLTETNLDLSFGIKNQPEYREKSLQILLENKLLAPIPEIHWSVNRPSSMYSRRLGADVKKYLEELASNKSPLVFFEFGSGNGAFKKEITDSIPGIQSFSLCDKIYYPIDSFISNILDFEKLEKAIGASLSPNEKKHICDVLYKLLVIKEGQTHLDSFEYDTDFFKDAEHKIENIVSHLIKKAQNLNKIQVVPSNISARRNSAEVYYPNKITKGVTQSSKKVFEYLSNDICQFLHLQKDDYLHFVEAHSEGTFIGDFTLLKNLKNEQVDFAISSRSSIYLPKEEYINFVCEVSKKLSPNGIYIDDSVRGNDGWYYNLAELKRVQEKIKTPIKVITGAGFPKEDYCQENVPLSLVISNSKENLQLLESHLLGDCRINDLDILVQDDNFLKKLNPIEDYNNFHKKTTFQEVLNLRGE
jgi:hypothetical protein